MFIIFSFFVSLHTFEYAKMDFTKNSLETLSKEWVGYVTAINGKVYINRYNDDGSKIMFNFLAEEHTLINQKDEISVTAKSKIDILLKNENTLSLSSNTVFKIFQHDVELTKQKSFFSLLLGTVKASVKKLGEGSEYQLVTPNSTLGVRGTEFVAQYNSVNKSTKVACLEGLVSVKTVVEKKDDIIREQLVKPNQYLKIESIVAENKDLNQMYEPKSFSKKILTGINVVFEAEDQKIEDPWNYTEVSTSLLRFSAGMKYASYYNSDATDKRSYYPIFLKYNPLFHIYSFLYVEPSLDFTPLTSSDYILRASVNLNFQIWKGFYFGAGYGASASDNNLGNSTKLAKGISVNAGYTFLDKFMGVLDGYKITYELDDRAASIDETDLGFHQKTLMLGLVFNLNGGRNRW